MLLPLTKKRISALLLISWHTAMKTQDAERKTVNLQFLFVMSGASTFLLLKVSTIWRVHNTFGGMRDLAYFEGGIWDAS